MRLQRAAADAVRKGMVLVDEQIKKQKRFRGHVAVPEPQVALVAIDPHTGEVKALVGGRNYGMSQLNHVMASGSPGRFSSRSCTPPPWIPAWKAGRTSSPPAAMVVDQPTVLHVRQARVRSQQL